jgi:hypothetical protein
MIKYLYYKYLVNRLKRKKRRCVPWNLYYSLDIKYREEFKRYVYKKGMHLCSEVDVVDGFNWEGD